MGEREEEEEGATGGCSGNTSRAGDERGAAGRAGNYAPPFGSCAGERVDPQPSPKDAGAASGRRRQGTDCFGRSDGSS